MTTADWPSVRILFRDEHMVVVDKPAGLLVHPSGQGGDEATCLSLLSDRLEFRLYPVHRLDRQTSGVLVFALTRDAIGALNRQFAQRAVDKRYLAIVCGFLDDQVCHHLLKGKPAETQFVALARGQVDIPIYRASHSRFSLVEARPKGGYFHQIRRHCKRLGCPVVGDSRRGDKVYNRLVAEHFGFEGLALHAHELRLRHPRTDEAMVFSVAQPTEFLRLQTQLSLEHRP